jgi:hypothetical protein
MKKLNYFVMLGLSATLVLASCSQQRYASRSKVRVNDQAKEQVKEEKKEVATIAPKPTEQAKPEVNQAEVPQVLRPEVALPQPKEVLKQLTSKEAGRYLRQIVKNPEQIQNLVVKPNDKAKQGSEADADKNTHIHDTWLRWIIIGLVLVLIGIILPNPIGWICYLIGSVLIVLGLIFLLLSLL